MIKTAERRMLSKSIVESDAFLDMPLSAQALYMHLSMTADDCGFVNSPKSVARMIGAKEQDIHILTEKKFIIGFPSGVIVIKHWNINNQLRKDRPRKTNYQEELAMLESNENESYTLVGDCLADDRHVTTKSKDDGDAEEISIAEERSAEDRIDYRGVIELFHTICVSYPKVRVLSEARKKSIRARFNQYTIEDFTEVFEKAEASDFLKGKNDHNWSATFDWLIADKNMAKVLDGNYDADRSSGNTSLNRTAQRLDQEYQNILAWGESDDEI